MKKSSVVVLTIVAALTLSSCAVPKAENLGPPDPVYAEQIIDTSDTTRQQAVAPPQVYVAQPQSYRYYYRSYFWDNLYRIFCPQRYRTALSRPGFVPRRLRSVHGDVAHATHPSRSSGRRGGFGHHGSSQAAHA